CNLATSLTLHYFHPNCRFTLQTYSILDVHLHYYNTIFGNSEALYKKLLFRKLQLSSFIISLLKFHIKHITSDGPFGNNYNIFAEEKEMMLYFEQQTSHNCSLKRSWLDKLYISSFVKFFIWILLVSSTQSNEIEKRLGSMRSRDGIPTCFLRKI
ncbi:hypothetical protein T4B_8384, partial [Trichinella pseudospiralis]